MKIDKYKTIIRESEFWPGSIGDSCAETSRYEHLVSILEAAGPEVDLHQFVTATGFIRHPTAPIKDDKGKSWRETDFVSDQALPLFLASQASDPSIANIMRARIRQAGWRTGNGDLVSPGLFALLTNRIWLLNICTVVQGLIFKFPWRWNDEKKALERSNKSSADYLNWIHASIHGGWLTRKMVFKSTLKAKIRNYYQAPQKDPNLVEPNTQWIVDLYDQAIDKYF